MKRYGVKKDANHKDVVDALEKLGAGVVDLSSVGCGVPDLVVWCKDVWHLVDIKNANTAYGKRGLNKRQRDWATNWKGGPVYMLYTIEDAAELVNGRLQNLKRFPEAA